MSPKPSIFIPMHSAVNGVHWVHWLKASLIGLGMLPSALTMLLNLILKILRAILLPLVQIVYGSGNMLPDAYTAFMQKQEQKPLSMPEREMVRWQKNIVPTLTELQKQGVQIIRSFCVPQGFVLRNAEQPDDKYNWVVAHDLNYTKSQITGQKLALTKTKDAKEMQRIFWEY